MTDINKLEEVYSLCLLFHNRHWDSEDGGDLWDDAQEFLVKLHEIMVPK